MTVEGRYVLRSTVEVFLHNYRLKHLLSQDNGAQWHTNRRQNLNWSPARGFLAQFGVEPEDMASIAADAFCLGR